MSFSIQTDVARNNIKTQVLNSVEQFFMPNVGNSIAAQQPGQLRYSTLNDAPFYSNNGKAWVPFGFGVPGGTVTFRPGYTGTSTNIFPTWQEAYDAVHEIQGFKYLILDNADGMLVIPPGDWDMTDIEWFAPVSKLSPMGSIIPVTVQAGATLNGLVGITGPLGIDFQGASPCITVDLTANPEYRGIRLYYSGSISCSGTAPFINVLNGQFIVVLDIGSRIGNSPLTPCIVIQDNAQCVIAMIGTATFLEDNMVNALGAGGLGIFVIWDTSAQISVPLVQLGNAFLVQLSNPYVYKNQPGAPTVNDDANLGYRPGDMWIDNGANQVYICANNTPGAAVWRSCV